MSTLYLPTAPSISSELLPGASTHPSGKHLSVQQRHVLHDSMS